VSTDSKPIRILTADDHPLLPYGIGTLVGAKTDMELVAHASTGQEAIEQFWLHQPDVTLSTPPNGNPQSRGYLIGESLDK
jgi:DNA-binding NarL/FixJ family response regulator